MADNTKITPTTLADHLGTTPKQVRKFLRAVTPARAGKGGRWVIDVRDLEAITARYESWLEGRTTAFTLDED